MAGLRPDNPDPRPRVRDRRTSGTRLSSVAVLATVAFLVLASTASAAPPPNDNFEQAESLPEAPTTVDGRLDEATRQPGEPAHSGSGPHTVWYVYRPAQSGRVAVAANNFNRDAYRGSGLGALQKVGDQDACGNLVFDANAGESYWIAVSSFGTITQAPAPFKLTLKPAPRPLNDAFGDASRVRLFGTYTGSTCQATKEFGEPQHRRGTDPGRSLWFRFRPRRTQRLTLDTALSDFDTLLAVYRGRDLSRLRVVARDDDSGPGTTSLIRFTARRGTTYSIALSGYGGAGDFTLNVADDSARGIGVKIDLQEGQTLTTARDSGLRTNVRCRRECRLRLEAVVSRATARRLGLRSPVLGRAAGSLPGNDQALPATLRFSAQAVRALRRVSSVALSVRATLLGTRSRRRTVSTPITLTG